ncbi:MAG TPA: c-type cytochrome [Vicinamibacterales bacterium]|nr:c-type cytochrome [Vicinamibacterales bacterium]
MPVSRLTPLACLCAAAVLAGFEGQSSPSRQSWPPAVQQVPPTSPPLAPGEALKTFYMPPGYRLELVASEPLVQEPVAIDWDPDGRLWAVEMPGFMANLSGSNELDPIGRVVVLEDLDGDGRMDRRTVFAEGLVLARSIKVLDRGVLVAEPPDVWLMRDTDGDLRADTKDRVTDRYGRREADPQNNANGFLWALDNRMHVAGQGDVYLQLKQGGIDVLPTLQRGEWGLTQDDAGRIFRNTNESALHVDLVPTPYYARHPGLLRSRGSYERLADSSPDLNTVWPVRPNPGTNRAYQAGIDRADGTLAKFTAVCAPVVYRGDRLPVDLYGNVLVAEPAANLVSRIVLEDTPTGLRARKAYDRGEFLASTDERFRPVYLSNAPDGTLYVVDMYRGIIEHRISITVYLRDQILKRKLDQPTGLGRIYRVVHDSTARDRANPLARATAAELVATLSHPNGWWRDTAQQRLIERRETSAVPALQSLAESGDWRIRLHALWTLDGLDAMEAGIVVRALEDPVAHVRVAAVRIAERWLGTAHGEIDRAVLGRRSDPDAAVRRQLAASLAVVPGEAFEHALASLLESHGDDPVTVDAALSGLHGRELNVLAKLFGDARGAEGYTPGPALEAAVPMVGATIVRSAQDADAQTLFAWMGNRERPLWQRAALLEGAEIALLGAAMPGTPAPRPGAAAANLPCATCPGGRAGPGGAYAFPRPPGWGRDAGRGGPVLRLSREPEVNVSASEPELATRLATVLARVTWPGKPGAPSAVPPLGPEERRRFEAGREVYRNICQACHQPDGRGQEKVAPPLVGSPLTLGDPAIAARILLNGKEGPIGLMPPAGAVLSDEQIAGVLTYIRREWGQTATPVGVETVQRIRTLTADRTRPWTEAELMKIR